MRTSSPCSRPVASVKSARYVVVPPSRMLPMVAASTPGGQHGDHDEHDELDERREGLHDCVTAVPRAIGPNSSVARSGTSLGARRPCWGATRASTTRCSSAVPAAPAARVDAGRWRDPGPTRRRSWTSACRRRRRSPGHGPRRARQPVAVRAPVLAPARLLAGLVARARAHDLEGDVQLARWRTCSADEVVAAGSSPCSRHGYSGEYLASSSSVGRPTALTWMMRLSFSAQEVPRGGGEAGRAGQEAGVAPRPSRRSSSTDTEKLRSIRARSGAASA